MAGRRLIETSVVDLISPLPVELKHRILECLSTRDATRTALLSTHWNHVWLQHGRLAFDWDFSDSVQQGHDDEGKTLVHIINNILLSRAVPVKKFTLCIGNYYPELRQFDFDRWCVFLSTNGVEELNIHFVNCEEAEYKLPFCILSCRTIKQLRVGDCGGINKFEIISASKLERLSIYNCVHDVVESRWLAPHLKAIKTLCLCGSSLLYMDASLFATAINLQLLVLCNFSFGCGKQLTVAMQLFQKCPNLCELEILADEEVCKRDKEALSRLLEDREGCFTVQDLKMLKTIKIESFSGSIVEMLFVRMLLSKSPALERVVIIEEYVGIDTSAVECLRELLRFHRASPKAQICMELDDPICGGLSDYIWFD
ncbi:PREDICTED: uncharacterized protein LOC109163301 isoform X2 [Ipomoea nil]|uniref:uncharacterized protein LOC109163301 isoform X2 n=1 Tax=Ipomoea nil TaxID=35883 RepID=UPI000900F03F|nr:PREDICTED: uncharacterized protein LOC109163301 isoform X2 [Ipomoea nil]